MFNRSSFTLIELLVVIAILAILAVAVVLVINPIDLMRQSRDSTRLTDLNSINKALALFDVTNPDDFTGTSTIIYTSLPDTSSTCSGLTPPSGYLYHCVTSSTLTKIDGTGWIPANLSNISYGSPIGKLPLDPENSSTTGRFYTYIMGGSWELNAVYESAKYKGDVTKSEEGLPGVLSVGSNLNLNPVYTTNGLIAYYRFDEQTGTTLNDRSGNGYTGTITAGSGGWAADQQGNARAYEFDGAGTTIPTTMTGTSSLINGFTVSVWIRADSIGEAGSTYDNGRIVDKSDSTHAGNGFRIGTANFNSRLTARIGELGTILQSGNNAASPGSWNHNVTTFASSGLVSFYINGAANGSGTTSSTANIITANPLTIGNISGGTTKTFDGRISDLRIYNRVLSAIEIKAIYDATK